MSTHFYTDLFKISYVESSIDAAVLWESHCHAQFELIGVLEGDITIAVEGQSYRLTQNQATVIPPLCYHTVTANKHGSYRRMMIWFDEASIPSVLQGCFVSSTNIAIFSTNHIEALKGIYYEENAQFYAPLANALITQALYEQHQALQEAPLAQTDAFLQKSVAYIEQHLHEHILLEDLARLTSRSQSSFCHLFEKKMQISPKQYILQKKLAIANKRIREGTPPSLVAVQLGYDNYSNFYRMYLKQYGVAPTKKPQPTHPVLKRLRKAVANKNDDSD